MQVKVWDSTQQQWIIARPKINKNDSWTDATVKLYQNNSWTLQNVRKLPNYSDDPQEVEYGWGYYLLSSDAQRECYKRLVNAWIYSDKYGSYYYTDFKDGNLYQVLKVVTTYQAVTGLKIYLKDLELSEANFKTVFKAVRQDMVGGVYKYYFDNMEENYLFSLIDTYLIYAYLPYYPWLDQKSKLGNMQNAVDEVNALIKHYYNIDYMNQKFTLNLKRLTSTEKKYVVKVIHDYLVRHNIYGSSTTPYTGNQIAWSALSNHVTEPVCAGYARAFSYLCTLWGITSLIVPGYVSSESNGNHMWNEVHYGQKRIEECTESSDWSEMDVTWDDPTLNGQDDSQHTTPYPDYLRWKYFNVSTSWIAGDSNNTSHLRRPPATGGGNRLVESWPNNKSTNTDYNYGYNPSLGYSTWVIYTGDKSGSAKAYDW